MNKITIFFSLIILLLTIPSCQESDIVYTVHDTPFTLKQEDRFNGTRLYLYKDGSVKDILWVNSDPFPTKLYFCDSLVYVFGSNVKMDEKNHQYILLGEDVRPSIQLYNALMNSYNLGTTITINSRHSQRNGYNTRDVENRRVQISSETSYVPFAFSGRVREHPKFMNGGDTGFVDWMMSEIKISDIDEEWRTCPFHYYSFVVDEDGLITDIDDKCSIHQWDINSSNKTDNFITTIISHSPRWVPGSVDGSHYCKTRVYILVRYNQRTLENPISIQLLK